MNDSLLQQFFHAAYSTFDHNQIVIAYFVGFLISACLAVWKPSRFTTLVLLGFAVLGFGFEYDKHFVGPLTRQTLAAIVADPGAHVRTEKIINTFLGEVLPIVFYLVGWGFIFSGLIIGTKHFPKAQV